MKKLLPWSVWCSLSACVAACTPKPALGVDVSQLSFQFKRLEGKTCLITAMTVGEPVQAKFVEENDADEQFARSWTALSDSAAAGYHVLGDEQCGLRANSLITLSLTGERGNKVRFFVSIPPAPSAL